MTPRRDGNALVVLTPADSGKAERLRGRPRTARLAPEVTAA